MADKKQIMSWLEGLAQDDWPMFHSDSEVQEIAKNALELLKEQEVITPKISETATYHNGITSFRRIYSCGSCNGRISGDAAFCQNCGRAVKWNEQP
jgi:hypothetical protein